MIEELTHTQQKWENYFQYYIFTIGKHVSARSMIFGNLLFCFNIEQK